MTNASAPAQTSLTRNLSAADCISYLVGRNGNPELAALDAGRELGHPIAAAHLIAIIAADPSSPSILGQQLRMLMMIQAFEATRLTHTHFVQSISNLTARDAAKAYKDLIQEMVVLTSGAPIQLPDQFEMVKRALPPEIADAVDFFMRESANSNAQAGARMIEAAYRSPEANTATAGSAPVTEPRDADSNNEANLT